MANNGVLKMKMLALWEILRQDSDEEHPLSTNELCRKLNEKGIPCERKSIRTDMKKSAVSVFITSRIGSSASPN